MFAAVFFLKMLFRLIRVLADNTQPAFVTLSDDKRRGMISFLHYDRVTISETFA